MLKQVLGAGGAAGDGQAGARPHRKRAGPASVDIGMPGATL
ncbi:MULTISPECIES: hypothetical protein [unclassified Cupriavidus]|nr:MULTISPECIES: hypothetical protein [unclassified Cupriavidus]